MGYFAWFASAQKALMPNKEKSAQCELISHCALGILHSIEKMRASGFRKLALRAPGNSFLNPTPTEQPGGFMPKELEESYFQS